MFDDIDSDDGGIAMGETNNATAASGDAGANSVQTDPMENAVNVDPDGVENGGGSSNAAIPSSSSMTRWTAAAQLLLAWAQAKYEDREMPDSVTINVPVPVRRALRGAELRSYLDEQERLRQEQLRKEEELAMLREVELAKGQLRLGEQQQQTSSSQQEASETAPAKSSAGKMAGSAGGGPGVGVGVGSTRPKKKSRFDSSLFIKFSKPLHREFCPSCHLFCNLYSSPHAFFLLYASFHWPIIGRFHLTKSDLRSARGGSRAWSA